ncbi:unnamed protein product [Cuscuta campestris]|uniref:Reverse transcriptase zinc-binding domain-containing protein n=1 Tax=Cuscuta campestris TaxID=132261 RepID=A0A484KTJ4_9ASTE|nr:unnamed protein product [Cuscuta campestris]
MPNGTPYRLGGTEVLYHSIEMAKGKKKERRPSPPTPPLKKDLCNFLRDLEDESGAGGDAVDCAENLDFPVMTEDDFLPCSKPGEVTVEDVEERDIVNTVDAGVDSSDEEKGEPSVQSSFDTSIDEEEVARALQISLEQNLDATFTDDVDSAIHKEHFLGNEKPPHITPDTPLEKPTINKEKEKEKAPPDAGKSGDKLNENKVDKPVDGKKSFASFFKKNRAENKGMKLHKCKFLPHHQGWVVFKFLSTDDRDHAFLEAKKEINNKKLLINIPPDDFMWDIKSFSTMPVWVKLWNVPMSHTAASKLSDEDQEENDELKYQKPNYCRMLINMDLSLTPPTSVEVEFVGGSYVQKVEYEDMPQYCYHCKCFGHDPFNCSVLHEINKRRFNEEQKAKERARVETLKTIMLTEAQVTAGKQPQPQKGKDTRIDDVNNTAEYKGKEKDKLGGVAQNPNDPGPSFTAHTEDDGFTQVGGGKGKLTTHPIKDGKQRTGYNKGGGQNGGYRVLATTNQCIHCKIKCLISQKCFFISFVYALYCVTARRTLWDYLTGMADSLTDPWAIMGDFNSVISSSERVNCQSQSAYFMSDLRHFRLHNDLTDSNSTGLEFTWNKGDKWAKLDRVLVNYEWDNLDWECWAEFRDMEIVSDHCPVLLKLLPTHFHGTKSFKFYNMWTKHDDFDRVVRQIWDQRIVGTRQYRLCTKLKKLKYPLKQLNRHESGHITQKAEDDRKMYSTHMKMLILDPNNPILIKESDILRKKANFYLDAERFFFQQKTKCDLVTEGDKCTKLFHNLMKKRNTINAIPFLILEDDRVTTSQEEIASEFIQYFTQLFGRTVPIQPVDWDVFQEGPTISPSDCITLTKKIDIAEVKEALFSIEGHLPVKYLGLPLTSQRASERDFASLVEMIDDNIKRWNTKTLSMAGRAELIRTVIQGIEGFWLQAFPIHKIVLNRITTLCRSFLWGSKFFKEAWDDICKPKEEGGLGLRNSGYWNQALMAKTLWNIASRKETLWVQWVHAVYLQDRDIWTWTPKKEDSHFFKKLAEIRDILLFKIGPGTTDQNGMDMIMANGNICTSKVYDLIRTHGTKKASMRLIWQSYIPPRFSFTTWLALRKRLPTKVNLSFIHMDSRQCSLCGEELETTNHLFFACVISNDIWKGIRDWLHIPNELSTIKRAIKWLLRRHGVHSNRRNMWRFATLSTIHHIWKMRNQIYFDNQGINYLAVIKKIKVGVYKIMYRLYPHSTIALLEMELISVLRSGVCLVYLQWNWNLSTSLPVCRRYGLYPMLLIAVTLLEGTWAYLSAMVVLTIVCCFVRCGFEPYGFGIPVL